MEKNIGLAVGFVLVAGVSFFAGTQFAPRGSAIPTTQEIPGQASEALIVRADDSVLGRTDAPVLLIEYSDFECPFCKRFHPTAARAVEEYGGDVAWVYRHLPLPMHETADEAAAIGYCIQGQSGSGAFWRYADRIFEEQGSVSPSEEYYLTLAEQVGLSRADGLACLERGSPAYAAVEAHTYEASAVFGIEGTPGSIIVNTETGAIARVPGAVPYEQLQSLIDSVR